MGVNEIFITKMCHDLAGTIGSLNNTAELLSIDKSFVDDGVPLLMQSTKALVSKLKFFRALLGSEMAVAPEIAKDYLDALPMSITLQGIASSRIQLAFVLFGSEILIRGGSIQLNENGFTCCGKSILCDVVKKDILLKKEEILKPQYMSSLWILEWMKQEKMRVEFFENEEALSVRFLRDDF